MPPAHQPARGRHDGDHLTIPRGTTVSVVDQGGEPYTFTEVAHFGGGFVEALNHGEPTVPECDGGFENVAVARTRRPMVVSARVATKLRRLAPPFERNLAARLRDKGGLERRQRPEARNPYYCESAPVDTPSVSTFRPGRST
jgi:hypothetical protein